MKDKLNILLILTGGTICSFADETGERSADVKKAETLIVDIFNRSDCVYAGKVKFKTKKVLNVLSENMTLSNANTLIGAFKKEDLTKYDGVIVLHGTDTLAYTSSLLSIALSGTPIPVILVSSALPIYMENANGRDNFRTATELIAGGIAPNVYAVYKNSDGIVYLHEGDKLRQCENSTSDFFSDTMTKCDFNVYTRFKKSLCEYAVEVFPKLLSSVLVIKPYTGIDYSHFSLRGVKAVLHMTYHSSTAPSMSSNCRFSLLSLKKRCDKHSIPIYLYGCDEKAYDYETTGALLRNGIKAIPDNLTLETVYSRLNVGCALGLKNEALDFFVHSLQRNKKTLDNKAKKC